MTVASASDLSAAGSVPAVAPPARAGHALPVGAAGFAWCSLALGLSTAGVMNTAGSSVILSGTFFYGGIVQLVAGFFALAAGATFAAFSLLNLTIVLLVIAYLGASSAGAPVTGALHAAGWVEIVLAGVAFYIVLAELANETLHRQVFPLFPLRRSAAGA